MTSEEYKNIYGIKGSLPAFDEYKELLKAQVFSIVRSFFYEPNDEETREKVTRRVNELLYPLVDLGIVFEANVICDETNNTEEIINSNSLKVSFKVKVNESDETVKTFSMIVVGTACSWEDMN